MRVEQAVYGEVQGRGHGLRASSPNASLASTIASKLDLPDSVPPGLQDWSPFVRGFPIEDHYVLARTFLDSSASRGGMVVTHALIISLDDMCQVESLAMLFEYLAPSITECPSSMATLDLDTASSISTPAVDLIGTANALAAQGPSPLVRLGIKGFELLVDSLWRNLWPAFRRTFAFRLSFGPNDVVEHPVPALVCTPEQLQARWTKHHIVKPDDSAPDSESAEILCGQRDIQPILALAEELGHEIQNLRELSRLERLHSMLSNGKSFADLLTAIRLTDGLSNQPTQGISIKSKLIDHFIDLIPSADCKQLLPMRNLALSGFANTGSLWSAIELLVSTLGFTPEDDMDMVEMVVASANENLALPPWRAAVKAGLSTAARRNTPAISQAIWRWAEHSQAAFAAAVGCLPADELVEQRLADETPRKLNATTQSPLLSSLLKKRWFTAYGAALASMLPPLEAVDQQLKVDNDPAHSAGLRSALRYASPSQTLECALKLKDSRLVRLSADLTVAYPQILSNICCKDIIEQQVWGAAIRKDPSLWNAPNNPAGARDTVLAQLAKGLPVDTSLLEALAQTPLADLCATSERELLWPLLPASQCESYLQATATGWLDQATKSSVVLPPEALLERTIIASSSLQSVLEKSSISIDIRLAIIKALPSFTEGAFIDWLNKLLKGAQVLSNTDSELLGTLVTSRGWKRAAEDLSRRLANQRADLLPGLRVCAGLLDFYTSWMRGISKPSITQKWEALEKVVRELYPSGPDCHELWSRAGGKNSDLLGQSQSGATRWHAALDSIRSGGRPHMSELITVMCQDFPDNEKLRLCACDTDIIGQQ
ncbi:GAP1-N1 domain-containing protein [Chromobacterium amazonense]|uniref:GAP1-N1 domain-containing protein n=1 Tax=Chromobacterium amazonense TaxID=1382803 RepID=UPI003F7975D2